MAIRRNDDDHGDAPTRALLDALRRLLRPIARLLLEKQITFPVLGELVKEVLVEVAEERFEIGARRQTDSRLSLLTGIHRKDIKRLRRGLAREERISSSASLGALLVSRWLADPDYLAPDGTPLDLPRVSRPTGGPSFEKLVFSASKDITVRSVLDEWIRLGIAELDDGDIVKLRVESFVPEADFEDKVYFFGRNLRDHAAAGVHNLLGDDAPFFDRSVFYDRLSADSVAELKRASVEIGSRSIREMNQLALELQTRDDQRSAAETSHRMSWGAYFFSSDEARDDAHSVAGEELNDEESGDE